MKEKENKMYCLKVKRDEWEYVTKSITMFHSTNINDSHFYKGKFAEIDAANDLRDYKKLFPAFDFKIVEVERVIIEKS